MSMADYKKYNTDGRSSEDRALDKFAEMMIEKINTLQNDWKKPWFTEGSLTWPKNLSGREYNGMNALMLMMHCEKQGYKLPVFCTFDRVAGLNFNKDKQGRRQQVKDNNGGSSTSGDNPQRREEFPGIHHNFHRCEQGNKGENQIR